jgi:hypothetical protein
MGAGLMETRWLLRKRANEEPLGKADDAEMKKIPTMIRVARWYELGFVIAK